MPMPRAKGGCSLYKSAIVTQLGKSKVRCIASKTISPPEDPNRDPKLPPLVRFRAVINGTRPLCHGI
jgi:hypothetical protein